jgi:hypothetical protein
MQSGKICVWLWLKKCCFASDDDDDDDDDDDYSVIHVAGLRKTTKYISQGSQCLGRGSN